MKNEGKKESINERTGRNEHARHVSEDKIKHRINWTLNFEDILVQLWFAQFEIGATRSNQSPLEDVDVPELSVQWIQDLVSL